MMDVRVGDILVVKDSRKWNSDYTGSMLLVESTDAEGWTVRFISRPRHTLYAYDVFKLEADYYPRADVELEIVGHIDV